MSSRLSSVGLVGCLTLGFVDFCAEDQATLIRLGQSSTRILAACIHWYDAEHMDFKNFLSWRSSDLFKMKSVRHAQRIHALDIDHIEAALLNVTTLIATGIYLSVCVCVCVLDIDHIEAVLLNVTTLIATGIYLCLCVCVCSFWTLITSRQRC